VLAEEQRDIADRFARKGFDRFDGLAWSAGESGAPLLEGALATMECEVRQRVAAGDHDILVGEMVGARVADGAPLVYFRSRYRSLE
jgi:flavin reductase (DIM6/NTAB) family NADH-FMN oxidoreductase RutF